MSRRIPLQWATLLIGISMLAAGCGGDTSSKEKNSAPEAGDSTYESMVSEIHGEMNSAMSAAFATQQLDANLVRAARTTATDSLTKMKSATPPKKFRPAHDEYTAGLEAFAAILADVERQVDEPDVARRHLGDKRFSTGVAHLEKATTLYDEAGLDLDAGTDPAN